MASFLHYCINGCGSQLRATTAGLAVPTVCGPCQEAIAANEAEAALTADEWVHRGSGYYINTATGEKRRGKPK